MFLDNNTSVAVDTTTRRFIIIIPGGKNAEL